MRGERTYSVKERMPPRQTHTHTHTHSEERTNERVFRHDGIFYFVQLGLSFCCTIAKSITKQALLKEAPLKPRWVKGKGAQQ
jgi:hypothetical protein